MTASHVPTRSAVPSPVDPFETVLQGQAAPITARLTRMLGDAAAAEDLCQDTFLAAWRKAPRELGPEQLRAWLHRTARNLALDELRRRGRRPTAPLADEHAAHADPDDGAATAALAALTPHQRLVLLLRFEAGLSLRELGALLDIETDAARKRVARARAAFASALREVRAGDTRPTVLVLMGREDPGAYAAWLRTAGARVRFCGPDQIGLDLAGADALVLSGSTSDVNPRMYGAAADPRTVVTDLTRDLRDAAALRTALASDLPVVGICRGAQLLSVLFGGSLTQHVDDHLAVAHPVTTAPGSAARRALGVRPEIPSDHHQAVDRLGRGLVVTATSPDGLAEAVEVPGRRLALGTQWHPERGGGEPLARLIVETAAGAA